MRKLYLLLLFLGCLYGKALGQYYPPFAVSAQNPSGQLVFVAADSSGNLYTNGLGSSGAPTAVSGYVPPMAMTAQNPSGVQVYLKTDANGNLYVNCTTGCSGGGGGGTVTSIIFNAPLSGGTVTTTGTVGCTTCVTSSSPGAGLAHFAGSTQAVTSSAVSLSADVSGNLPNANLAAQTANTVMGALTATTPSGLAMPSCSGASNALIWTTGTGFGCNTISGGGGSAFPETVSGTTTSGGIPYFSNTTTLTSSAILNTNILVKGGGAGGAPTNSSVTDNGTTVATTDTGGFVGPSFTFNGTTAGFYDFPQGSTSSGVAPCNTANSVCIQAPTSVTAYVETLPAAQPAASQNFMSCTAANPTVCSFVQILWSQLGNASGNLTLANGTNTTEFDQTSAANWTWANITAASNGAQKQAPIFNFCGQAWEGGSLANTQSCFTMQQQFCSSADCTNLNSNNATPHLVIQSTDVTTTNPHNIAVRLQGVDIFFDASKNNMNIGGQLPAAPGTQIIAIGHGTLQSEFTNGGGDTVVGYSSMVNANGDQQNTVVGGSAGNSCSGCVGVELYGYNSNAGASSTYSVGIGDGVSLGSFTQDIVIGTSLSAAGNYDIEIGNVTPSGANDIMISSLAVTATAANQVWIGNTSITDNYFSGIVHTGNGVSLSAPTTITSATFVTTGLAFPVVPINTTLRGRCSIIWEQSTATNTVQFGAGMNNAPTDLYVMDTLHSGTGGSTLVDQYTTITSNTTTAISPTGAPGATATGYKNEIDFTLITGATNSVTLTVYALTGSTSDAVVIEPGSSCGWL